MHKHRDTGPSAAESLTKVVALAGPTGVGKTELSLRLAELLQAEIISADSMQVYRGMDIGTAKATPAERQRVLHHLLDLVEPDQPFSVARYQELARQCIAGISARGNLPMLVGGTGLYLRAALEPYDFRPISVDSAFRQSLQERAAREGSEALHRELQTVDPLAAAKLHVNDLRRIIRALEVYHFTGERISLSQQRTAEAAPLYDAVWIGLNRPRSELYRRIDRRVEQMVEAGLLDEVNTLFQQGWGSDSIAGQALGYKEFIPYLQGNISLDEAIAKLQQDTRRYAKRQLSWFRAEKKMIWYELNEASDIEALAATIAAMIRERFA